MKIEHHYHYNEPERLHANVVEVREMHQPSDRAAIVRAATVATMKVLALLMFWFARGGVWAGKQLGRGCESLGREMDDWARDRRVPAPWLQRGQQFQHKELPRGPS